MEYPTGKKTQRGQNSNQKYYKRDVNKDYDHNKLKILTFYSEGLISCRPGALKEKKLLFTNRI